MTGCIHHRWFVVMAAFSVRAIVYGITYTSGIVYVIILKNFQTGKAETSWISSIITTVVFAAGKYFNTKIDFLYLSLYLIKSAAKYND